MFYISYIYYYLIYNKNNIYYVVEMISIISTIEYIYISI